MSDMLALSSSGERMELSDSEDAHSLFLDTVHIRLLLVDLLKPSSKTAKLTKVLFYNSIISGHKLHFMDATHIHLHF